MKKILAKDLKVGDRYKSGSTVQEVTKIEFTTAKSICFRTKRIAPDQYDGNFFQRPSLTKKLELI